MSERIIAECPDCHAKIATSKKDKVQCGKCGNRFFPNAITPEQVEPEKVKSISNKTKKIIKKAVHQAVEESLRELGDKI